ncbi:MAG: hypothetical protein GWP08_01995 [Nitrospiraceae bacterium]|nr:hypothetical protein [Nitrospiraceae bacterium]
MDNEQLHFINTDAVNPVFTAQFETKLKPGFTFSWTIPTADSTFGGGYVWGRMFYQGADLSSCLVSAYGGQYNLFAFATGALAYLPLASYTVTVQYVVTTEGVDVFWGADGAMEHVGGTTPTFPAALDPEEDVTIALMGGTNWYAGASAFDIAVDDVTITSDQLPQCVRDLMLPVAGVAGLLALAAAVLAGGTAFVSRKKKQ